VSKNPLERPIIEALQKSGGLTVVDLSQILKRTKDAIASCVCRLYDNGVIDKVGPRGWHQQKLYIARSGKEESKKYDWMIGWGNSPRLGLDGFEQRQKIIIHKSTYRY
jgi:hypothetical protein